MKTEIQNIKNGLKLDPRIREDDKKSEVRKSYMKLNIYSLKNVLYHGDATAVNCKTTSGEITVLDHHQPLISVLPKGVIKVTDAEQKDRYFEIASGFLEVCDSHDMCLLVEEQ